MESALQFATPLPEAAELCGAAGGAGPRAGGGAASNSASTSATAGPEGSPFKWLLQVVVAAFRKRKVDVPEDAGLLYHNKELDAPIAGERAAGERVRVLLMAPPLARPYRPCCSHAPRYAIACTPPVCSSAYGRWKSVWPRSSML